MKKLLVVILILGSFLFNTSSAFSRIKSTERFPSSFGDEPPYFVVPPFISSKDVYLPSIDKTEKTQETRVSTPDSFVITLSFAGDCTLGDDEKYQWNTFDEVYQKVNDPSYFFQGVQNIFAYDDFTFINLEGPLTRETQKAEKEYRFIGDPSYIDILKKGSIEGVTLANNHSMDYLEAGFSETVKALEVAQIKYTYFDRCFIKDIKGIKIGFLGYKGWEHEKRSNDLLTRQVKEMRDKGADFIIANYHWGDQNSYTPNALQKRMAHLAIDTGVDLVIGHHPHVLQGMEVYKGKNIVYSLGNFCFGGAPNPKDKDTLIYQQLIVVDASSHSIIETSSNIIPVKVSGEFKRNNYQPITVYGQEAERILKKYRKISQGLDQ